MTDVSERSTEQRPARPRRHLVGETSDFLALGGASLFVLPLFALLPHRLEDTVLFATMALANVINHPHFAVSYGLFYRDFGTKVQPGRSDDVTLHWRYRFAGIVVPIVLIVALGTTLAADNVEFYGYGFNLMVLTVGWHYVKQGYGMAMVDAALKGCSFNDREKRVMRANGYVAWATAWALGNVLSDRTEFLGVPITLIDIATPVLIIAIAALIVTTVAVASSFAARVRDGRQTPWTGVTAYLVSLYPWMVFVAFDPLVSLIVPALHSLQYLWVVSRYTRNRSEAEPGSRSFKKVFAWSTIAGIAMFWVIPLSLDSMVGYDEDRFGPLAFVYLFWIAINIHHYFLDNVMWRRGNPDVTQFLFAR